MSTKNTQCISHENQKYLCISASLALLVNLLEQKLWRTSVVTFEQNWMSLQVCFEQVYKCQGCIVSKTGRRNLIMVMLHLQHSTPCNKHIKKLAIAYANLNGVQSQDAAMKKWSELSYLVVLSETHADDTIPFSLT